MKIINLLSSLVIGFSGLVWLQNASLAGSFRGVTEVTGSYSNADLNVKVTPILKGNNFSTGAHTYYYAYHGTFKGESIDIYGGAKNFGSDSRQVYTWDNQGTKYQVIWRPSDPHFIRLRVLSGERELLNRILSED